MALFDMPIEVEREKNPNPVYFIPVISYIILVIAHFMGLNVPLGTALAYIGVASITPSVQLLLVVYGLSTDEWYELKPRGKDNLELFLLSMFGLFAITFSSFLLGQSDTPIPTMDLIVWFIMGFIGFVGMNETFMYFYENDVKNSSIAFIMSLLVGLAYIIIISILGGI